MSKKKTKDSTPDFKRDFVEPIRRAADNIGGVLPPQLVSSALPLLQPYPVITQPPVWRKRYGVDDSVPKDATLKQSSMATDSFANFTARLGIQASNISSTAGYALGPFITRNRIALEAAYRDSWVVGKAIDCIAEDMTQAGISMHSKLKPAEIKDMQVAISEFKIWHDLGMAIKWARLYGGCLAVMMIDGHNYEAPLDITRVGKDKFKGLVVLDRWMVQPSMGELITDLGTDIGMPKFYQAMPGVSTFPSKKIHHTRCLRFDGIELPYYQKLFENLWGLSVVERCLDRLLAFDSATQGAAQLLYKSHLRVIRVKDFRLALAAGGNQEEAMMKMFMYIRSMQTNEGLTVLDAEDEFATHSYTFAGVSDALQQFGQQIAGSIDTPLVRLFGQSPAGFSTGDTDIRNYYDGIKKRQENDLRPRLDPLLAVIAMSRLGHALPDDFEFKFIPLWQMSENEKSEIAGKVVDTVVKAKDAGLIPLHTAMKELQESSRITGVFTNITDEDIEEAENNPPEAPMPGAPGAEGGPEGGEKKPDETKGAEKPNERLGAADPDVEKEKIPEKETQDVGRSSVRDIFNIWREKRRKILNSLDTIFKEEEHPRGSGEKGGQFVSKGEGGTSGKKEGEGKESKAGTQTVKRTKSTQSFEETKRDKEGKVVLSSGKPLPKHMVNTYIAPAWENVLINPDPKGDLWAVGHNKEGKIVGWVYSDEHNSGKDIAKDSMYQELRKQYTSIVQQLNNDYKDKDKKESAFVTKIIANTGARIGSQKEAIGIKGIKTYGASTLEARHIVAEKDGTVKLDFIGKDAKRNIYTVTDKKVADELKSLVAGKKPADNLFAANYNMCLNYVKSLDGGGFTPKSFRLKIATDLALQTMKTMGAPTDPKDYKKKVLAVAKTVAEQLNNTPAIALKQYIVASIWTDWKTKAGVGV